MIISDLTEYDSAPIWVEAIGITVGCLLGILVPKLILGSASDNHGINRATALNNMIGSLSAENIKTMLVQQEYKEID